MDKTSGLRRISEILIATLREITGEEVPQTLQHALAAKDSMFYDRSLIEIFEESESTQITFTLTLTPTRSEA